MHVALGICCLNNLYEEHRKHSECIGDMFKFALYITSLYMCISFFSVHSLIEILCLVLTGYIHLIHNHELTVNDTDDDVPFNTYVYEGSHITLPPRNFFYGTELHAIGGKVCYKTLFLCFLVVIGTTIC